VAAGRVEDLAGGVAIAAATLDTGAAAALLDRLRREKVAGDHARAAGEEPA
jgi:anthranilate phosphoribosyltransferase